MDRTYDADGRREPGYFDSNQSVPQYTSSYSAEPRDSPSFRGTESSTARKRSSPPINDKMASGADRDELAGHAVSPELIAAITEKVKRERMCRFSPDLIASTPQTAASLVLTRLISRRTS